MTRSGIPRALSLLVDGHGWVNTSPSGICSSGCLSRHSRTTSGSNGILVPRMNDNPAACRAIWLASETNPASATTVTSVRWWGGFEGVDDRQHRGGLGLVALERLDGQGESGGVGQESEGD